MAPRVRIQVGGQIGRAGLVELGAPQTAVLAVLALFAFAGLAFLAFTALAFLAGALLAATFFAAAFLAGRLSFPLLAA